MKDERVLASALWDFLEMLPLTVMQRCELV